MVKLAPEGWPFVIAALALTLVFGGLPSVLGDSLGSNWRTALFGVAGILALFTAFTLFFFRDPVRTPPPGDDLVVAPGEGRVIQIVEVEEPAFMKGPATRISIFLSVFNVHLQRAPLSGVVGYRNYNPGKYLAAWNPKASEENEQASLGIDSGRGKILVRQIAGLIARRIVTDPVEGDSVIRGNRIGLIRFGSRVDLFIPTDWNVTCEVGDKVQVGQTVMARITEREGTS